jgi:hypothetical protein
MMCNSPWPSIVLSTHLLGALHTGSAMWMQVWRRLRGVHGSVGKRRKELSTKEKKVFFDTFSFGACVHPTTLLLRPRHFAILLNRHTFLLLFLELEVDDVPSNLISGGNFLG